MTVYHEKIIAPGFENTMKKLTIAILSVVLLAIACSKDRSILLVEETPPTPAEPQKEFVAAKNSTFEKLGTQAQTKTIKNDNDLPFVGKQGTQIWLYTRDLKTANGGDVTYPFDIEILELFTPKDMILHQMPTVSGGKLLTTAGQIRIRAYKDGKELTLNKYNSTQITVPVNGRPDGFMKLFYGEEINGGFYDWLPADSTKDGANRGYMFANQEVYTIFPSRIGWINCDKFYQYTEAKTAITFSSAEPPLGNIIIFLYFPDLKSIMKVYNGVSGDVPVGRNVKVIALGLTKEEEYYSFFQDFNVQDKQKIEIKLTPTTKDALVKYLDSL